MRVQPPARGLVALLLPLLLVACAQQPPSPPLPTVAAVDLDRYAGTWYELASLPHRFQAMCVSDTRADYRREDDQVRVRNRCRKADGGIAEANGIAQPVPGSGNARLRVSFFRPFYGDYWILDLDPDYRWALVGSPDRQTAWVLSRSPVLDRGTLTAVLDRAAALGFDRAAFSLTPHPQRIE